MNISMFAYASIQSDAYNDINTYGSTSAEINGLQLYDSFYSVFTLTLGNYGSTSDVWNGTSASDGWAVTGQANTQYTMSSIIGSSFCGSISANASITTGSSSGSGGNPPGGGNCYGQPEIDTISPTYGYAGDTNLPMSITGSNLDPCDGSLVLSTSTYPDPQGEVIWSFTPTTEYPGEIDGNYSINYYSNPSYCYIGAIVVQTSGGTVYSPDFNICYP